MMDVSLELIAIVALWVTTMGFLWNLHRDMGNLRKDVGKDVADLREHMARMEGLLKGFAARPQESQP